MLLRYAFLRGVRYLIRKRLAQFPARWVVNAARPRRRGFLTAIPIDVRVFHPALNNTGHPVFDTIGR